MSLACWYDIIMNMFDSEHSGVTTAWNEANISFYTSLSFHIFGCELLKIDLEVVMFARPHLYVYDEAGLLFMSIQLTVLAQCQLLDVLNINFSSNLVWWECKLHSYDSLPLTRKQLDMTCKYCLNSKQYAWNLCRELWYNPFYSFQKPVCAIEMSRNLKLFGCSFSKQVLLELYVKLLPCLWFCPWK